MNSPIATKLAILWLLVVVMQACSAEPKVEREEAAIAAIEERGGRIEYRDDTVIKAGFRDVEITDADLIHLRGLTSVVNVGLINCPRVTGAGLAHLKRLHNLHSLYLVGTDVGDAGLENLKGMRKLTNLYLADTNVTDAGLERLKGLTNLSHLYLNNTLVTDAGLEHLKDLTGLLCLNLTGTNVTDSGVKDLQASLPDCTISRDGSPGDSAEK